MQPRQDSLRATTETAETNLKNSPEVNAEASEFIKRHSDTPNFTVTSESTTTPTKLITKTSNNSNLNSANIINRSHPEGDKALQEGSSVLVQRKTIKTASLQDTSPTKINKYSLPGSSVPSSVTGTLRTQTQQQEQVRSPSRDPLYQGQPQSTLDFTQQVRSSTMNHIAHNSPYVNLFETVRPSIQALTGSPHATSVPTPTGIAIQQQQETPLFSAASLVNAVAATSEPNKRARLETAFTNMLSSQFSKTYQSNQQVTPAAATRASIGLISEPNLARNIATGKEVHAFPQNVHMNGWNRTIHPDLQNTPKSIEDLMSAIDKTDVEHNPLFKPLDPSFLQSAQDLSRSQQKMNLSLHLINELRKRQEQEKRQQQQQFQQHLVTGFSQLSGQQAGGVPLVPGHGTPPSAASTKVTTFEHQQTYPAIMVLAGQGMMQTPQMLSQMHYGNAFQQQATAPISASSPLPAAKVARTAASEDVKAEKPEPSGKELLEVIKPKPSRPMRFKCQHEGCNKMFAWRWSMESHAKTHLGEAGRTHRCPECKKGFFTLGSLKAHRHIHTRKENMLSCEYDGCSKQYKTREGLRLHIRNHHTVDKKWVCPGQGCNRKFVRQSDLRLHVLRMHLEEKPFPCPSPGCDKSFACQSELRRHMSFHGDAGVKGKAIQRTAKNEPSSPSDESAETLEKPSSKSTKSEDEPVSVVSDTIASASTT